MEKLMLFSIILAALILATITLEASPAAAESRLARHNRSHFLALTDFANFAPTAGERPGEIVLTSPELEAPLAWNELVVSWNAEMPSGTYLKIEARAMRENGAPKYYTLGLWSPDPALHPRESVLNQQDDNGTVLTDTLVLQQHVRRVQLRLTLGGPGEQTLPRLKLIGLSFLDSQTQCTPLEPNRAAWGKIIPVPERSQVGYEGGRGWCSPTSVSMALAYWAKVLNRPELDWDVPQVASSVYDKNWPGTGNWPFNTAFAGSLPGLRAYVTRLDDVSELEDWIAAGVPVILSVAYDTRQGRPVAKGSGHVLVCVGFTAQGDVVVNDPWAHRERGQTVRKTFSRQSVIAGWSHSRNTVYLIYPETAKLPRGRFGHWEAAPDERNRLTLTGRPQ